MCTWEYRVSFTTNQQNNKCSLAALPSYIDDPGVSFQLIRRFPWQPPEIQRLAQNCYCCRCQRVVQEVEGRRMYMTHTHCQWFAISSDFETVQWMCWWLWLHVRTVTWSALIPTILLPLPLCISFTCFLSLPSFDINQTGSRWNHYCHEARNDSATLTTIKPLLPCKCLWHCWSWSAY